MEIYQDSKGLTVIEEC